MKCYIISYDLRKPGRDYTSLYEAIKTYSSWAHIQESLWAVISIKTAVEIRNYLQQFIDGNDSIFVIKTGVEAAWTNTLSKDDWLKENLRKN